MYVPAHRRFYNIYDFSDRLDALGDVDESDMAKQHLRSLIEEKILYDDYVARYGASGLSSMLELSIDEARSLSPLMLFVTKRQERGSVSRGFTYNWKKLQVVRVNYKEEDGRGA